jgi:hypothetical protein
MTASAFEQIEAVAQARYNDRYGWSVIVECFGEEDCVRLGFINAEGQPDWTAIDRYVDVVSDRYEDVNNA